MKGPEARAGLNPSLFKIKGIKVPSNEASNTTVKSATLTTNAKVESYEKKTNT